jgi:hypothetical protein
LSCRCEYAHFENDHWEWLEAGVVIGWEELHIGDFPAVATAYLRLSTALMAQIAVLGDATALADRLVEFIKAAGNHLGTGFLARPHLLRVLADRTPRPRLRRAAAELAAVLAAHA